MDEEFAAAWKHLRKSTWFYGFMSMTGGWIGGKFLVSAYDMIQPKNFMKAKHRFAFPLGFAVFTGFLGSLVTAKNEAHHLHYLEFKRRASLNELQKADEEKRPMK